MNECLAYSSLQADSKAYKLCGHLALTNFHKFHLDDPSELSHMVLPSMMAMAL